MPRATPAQSWGKGVRTSGSAPRLASVKGDLKRAETYSDGAAQDKGSAETCSDGAAQDKGSAETCSDGAAQDKGSAETYSDGAAQDKGSAVRKGRVGLAVRKGWPAAGWWQKQETLLSLALLG